MAGLDMGDTEQQVETGAEEADSGVAAQPAQEQQKAAEPVDTRTPLEKKIAEGQAKVAGANEEGEKKTEGDLPGKTAEVVPPSYAPNFKFKVMDKDHEIPEKFRALIKDAESEKEVREIFEKALGLDVVKPKLQEERQARKYIQDEYTTLSGQINDLKTDYNRGDMDSFFQKLNIPFDKVLQYVAGKVNYEKLPPEQRQVLDSRQAAERRAYELERSQAQTQQQSDQMLAQAVQHALDLSLARTDVKTVAEAYDTRVGRPGAFKDEVVRRGEFYWVTQGKLVPPDQAVNEVLSLVGPSAPAAAAQPAVAAQNAGASTKKDPPVIPNVAGKQTSPLPTKPKSIKELKEIAAKM